MLQGLLLAATTIQKLIASTAISVTTTAVAAHTATETVRSNARVERLNLTGDS